MPSVEAEIAVLMDNVLRLFDEQARLRAALDVLTTERATISLLTREVEDLERDLPNLARQAAEETHAVLARQKRSDTLGNWRTYAALISAGAALGALIVALVIR